MGEPTRPRDAGDRVELGAVRVGGADQAGNPEADAVAQVGDGDRSDAARRVQEAERELLTRLAIGAAVSVVGGVVAWVAGRRGGRPQLRAFGRQNAAWGVVDGTIAAIGRATSARSAASRPPARHAGRLRAITAVNAVADVGYVAGGLRLVRGGRGGDGWAMALQGLFLLVLDAFSAKRFHDLRRALRSEEDDPAE